MATLETIATETRPLLTRSRSRDAASSPLCSLRPLPAPHRPADIVVLDQNILLDGKLHCYGSVLIEQLRASGFAGVACVITGDLKDVGRLSTAPGLDLVVTKSVNVSTLAKQLRQLAAAKASPPPHAAAAGAIAAGGAPPPPSAATPPAAAGSVPAPPPDAPPLIDLSHFLGLPHSSLQRLFLMAYHPSAHVSEACHDLP